jgi:hypothetical protein
MDVRPGNYEAKAVKWALGKAGTGTVQVGVRFALLDRAGQPTGPTGVWYGALTREALPSTVRALRACGWKGQDITELKGGGGLDANVVSLTVEEETYEGQTRTRIAWVNEPGIPMKAELTEGELQKLSGLVRDEIAKLK